MTVPATPSLETVKRRQAAQIVAFLVLVALGCVGLYHVVRAERVELRRGEQALARNDAKAAVAHLERAWGGGVRSPKVRLELAQTRFSTGDLAGALSLYTEAFAEDRRNESLLDTLSGLYQTMGQPDKAIALYDAPEKLSVGALTRLGDLQQHAGRLEEAAAAYRLAAEKKPGAAEAHLRLGIVLGWLGRPREAVTALRAALAADPQSRTAELYLARMLFWDGRFADAVVEYRRVLPP